MTNIEGEVELALLNHLSTLPLNFAWPASNHDGSLPHIQVDVFRNQSNRVTLKALSQYQGILQCTAVTKTDGSGVGVIHDLIDTIKDHFAADTKLSAGAYQVQVTQSPTIGTMANDGTTIRTPLSIFWEAYG